jgi:hypothetical protein
MSRLVVRPVTLKQANTFVGVEHRHHDGVTGHRWSLGAYRDNTIVGVAVVGRPTGKTADQYVVAEITRLCTDGSPHVCSFLIGRVRRAAQAMGYVRGLTYTLATEPGTSLCAAGCQLLDVVKGRSWDRDTRARTDSHPTVDKNKWLVFGDAA